MNIYIASAIRYKDQNKSCGTCDYCDKHNFTCRAELIQITHGIVELDHLRGVCGIWYKAVNEAETNKAIINRAKHLY